MYEDERYIHLIIELCEGGGLFDRIIRKSETVEGRYSESHAAKIMKKIVSGIWNMSFVIWRIFLICNQETMYYYHLPVVMVVH